MIKGKPVKSTNKNKKMMVLTPKGKIIHFGQIGYEDFTQHKDKKRRENYCKRSSGIKDKQGNLTKNNKESANYYSRKFLWSC
jgi:hypothetical protein